MVSDLKAAEKAARADASAMLTKLFADALQTERPGVWRVSSGDDEVWVLFLPDARQVHTDDDEPPQPALELIRPLVDLGFAGALPPDDARSYLRTMAEARYVRLTRRAHPDGNGRIAIAAVATLFVEDLDREELEGVAVELLVHR